MGVRARARLSSLFRPRPVPLVTLWSLFCVLLASKTLLIVIIAVVIIPIVVVVVVAVLIAEIPLWGLLIVSPCIVNMPRLEWTLISSLRLSRTFLHKIFSL